MLIPIEDDIDIEYEMSRQEHEIRLVEEAEERYPKLIFKYKSISSSVDFCRLLNIVRDNKIYLPNVKELNDPLEGFQCKMLGDCDSKRKEERNKYRVLALSEDGFLPTLWSHYADGYTGVCLCFKTDKTFSELHQVKYVNRSISWSVDPIFAARDDLEMKSSDWSYEKEWRRISKGDINDSEFLRFGKEELICIFLGYKMDPSVRKELYRNIPSHIKVFTVAPNEEKFCLFAKDADGNEVFNSQELIEVLET